MNMTVPSAQLVEISVVIPVYNEQDTLRPLVEKITAVMAQQQIAAYDIILVDDGSSDNSWPGMHQLTVDDPQHVKAVKLRKNFGKSTALSAGFRRAGGKIIFTLDADLQDDPADIPQFLQKLDEGFDLVSGWKTNRQDPYSKTVPSKIYNAVTAGLTGIRLHDFNCGFKAYRREVLEAITIYGELHRYIPVLAYEFGFRIAEIPVHHHPRRHGVSKYGIERYARGFLDLLTVITVTRYIQRPGHLFGGLGLVFGLFGSVSLSYLIVLWFLGFRPIGNRPLLLFGILAAILAVQLISLGLIAEISRRNNNSIDVEKLVQREVGFPPAHEPGQ